MYNFIGLLTTDLLNLPTNENKDLLNQCMSWQEKVFLRTVPPTFVENCKIYILHKLRPSCTIELEGWYQLPLLRSALEEMKIFYVFKLPC